MLHLEVFILSFQFPVDVLEIFVSQPLILHIGLKLLNLLFTLLHRLYVLTFEKLELRGQLIHGILLVRLRQRYLSLPSEALGRLLLIACAKTAVLVGHVDWVICHNLLHSELVRLHLLFGTADDIVLLIVLL